jgi:hypothetical protein
LARLARQAEDLGKAGRLDAEVRAVLAQMETEFAAVRAELEQIREELDNGS